MKDVNKIILIGRLGADPEPRQTKTGSPMTHFNLATSNSRLKSPEEAALSGERYTKETQWHRIVTFGKEANQCLLNLKKGEAVYVEGSLRTKSYTGKDGVKRMAFEVYANTVNPLHKKAKVTEVVTEVSAETPVN